MTTEMKQLLALLLLGCVFAHHEGEKGAEKKDPCTKGMAAVRLFMEYRGCAGPNPYQIMGFLLPAVSSNMTVRNMNNLFTAFCSLMFPRIKQCFQRNIQNCSTDQRNSLMRVVQQTGFVCQPNTNKTNSVIDHLLARLTDADLAKNETCKIQDLSRVRLFCTNQSLQAIRDSLANSSDMMNNLTMAQLAPKIQMYFRTMFECMVNQIRHRLSDCPQWRGTVIRNIRVLILPPVLGKSMPFTNDDLDRMFQWQSGAQNQASVEQDFLLNMFK